MTPELDNIVEALIFASPEGASTKEIARCIRSAVAGVRDADGENAAGEVTRHGDTTDGDVVAAISKLNLRYLETGRAFMLVERPAGWRIVSRMEYALWVRELFPEKKPSRLTPSALETLAIIAYRQPITRSSIEAVRGVGIDGPLQTLLDRNVVRIAGRADLPGRPLLYETTDLFLEHFGIRNVEELPNSAELRAVKLPEPEPPPEDTPEEGDAGETPDGEKPKKKPRAKKKEAEAPASPDATAVPEPASPAPAPDEPAPAPEPAEVPAPASAEVEEEEVTWSAPDEEEETPLTIVTEEEEPRRE